MKKKFYEYDANMSTYYTNIDVDKDDVRFYDVRNKPFEVYGFYDYRNQLIFKRLPDNIAESTNEGVAQCYLEVAGGRVRFTTDSQYIAIKAEFNFVGSNSRTPQLGIAGFDMYIDTKIESKNIISRRLNLNYTNLGFGGSARGEEVIAEYMSGLDMCMFVSDYDYNAADVNMLLNTHKRLYNIIREKNPDIPYLIISKPDFVYKEDEAIKRREVIFDTYRYACDIGDKNVHYIDGASFFNNRDWDNYFVDTTHPNDAGFLKMADCIEPVIAKALL